MGSGIYLYAVRSRGGLWIISVCSVILDIISIFYLQKELKNLQTLDLFHCKVTSLDNYRDKVFQLLPHIKFLDGLDRNEQEDQESSGEEEDDGKSTAVMIEHTH